MDTAGISEIRQEILSLPPKKVVELCMQLARYKKENKELLSFLLFEAHDLQGFVEKVKSETEEQFRELPKANAYLTRKSLRKILRMLGKYARQTASREAAIEMLLHFCMTLKNSGLLATNSKAFAALFEQQLKKIRQLTLQVAEDLQADYLKQLTFLQ